MRIETRVRFRPNWRNLCVGVVVTPWDRRRREIWVLPLPMIAWRITQYQCEEVS